MNETALASILAGLNEKLGDLALKWTAAGSACQQQGNQQAKQGGEEVATDTTLRCHPVNSLHVMREPPYTSDGP